MAPKTGALGCWLGVVDNRFRQEKDRHAERERERERERIIGEKEGEKAQETDGVQFVQ